MRTMRGNIHLVVWQDALYLGAVDVDRSIFSNKANILIPSRIHVVLYALIWSLRLAVLLIPG